MATQTALLDMYYLLVELIFGNFIFAWLGVCAIFLVFGFLTRMSMYSIMFLLIIFTFAIFAPMFGGKIVILIFIFALSYFVYSIYRYSSMTRG